MLKFLKIVLFLPLQLLAGEFCINKNILLNKETTKNCSFQKTLGLFSFSSKLSNHKYQYNEKYNVMILTKFKKEILNFIDKNCQKNEIIIKEVINFNREQNNYLTEVFLQCKHKYEKNYRRN
tara:strand:- start:1401 stop:1766 length:366 start_codon:yes stop_codon:yes gene_type:complete